MIIDSGIASWERVFDTERMQPPEYLNERPAPTSGPATSPRPPIPVIVRLELTGGAEEWWPGEALDWNTELVLVRRQSRPGDGTSTRFTWVPAGDVARVLRRPPGRGLDER